MVLWWLLLTTTALMLFVESGIMMRPLLVIPLAIHLLLLVLVGTRTSQTTSCLIPVPTANMLSAAVELLTLIDTSGRSVRLQISILLLAAMMYNRTIRVALVLFAKIIEH